MRRDAVGDGLLDRLERNDARDAHESAEGDNVGKEFAAALFDGETRNRDFDRMRERRNFRYEILVNDEQSFRIEVLIIFIRRFLRQGKNEIRDDDMRMINRLIVNDDFGL